MEALLVPAALVMPMRGVEDAALALRADPGPGLFLAALQDGDVLRQLVMAVGLIPSLEGLVALHRRMIRRHHAGGEGPIAMPFDLPADEVDVAIRLLETGRATMHRHEAAALLHEAPHRRELLRRDLLMIREDQQHVVLRQILRRERGHALLV